MDETIAPAPVALITGAGRGIGRAIALALAAAGWRCALLARSRGELAITAALVAASGGEALCLPADVTDAAAVDAALAEVQRTLGPPALLANNAGGVQAIGPLWEAGADDWWADVDLNLGGAVRCARAALPGMLARGSGRIVNVVSAVATFPAPHLAAYAAAKAGLLHLTACLDAETAQQGVRIFAVSPGLVRTDLAAAVFDSPAGRRWLAGSVLLEPWLPAERVAALIVAIAAGRLDALAGRYLTPDDDPQRLAVAG